MCTWAKMTATGGGIRPFRDTLKNHCISLVKYDFENNVKRCTQFHNNSLVVRAFFLLVSPLCITHHGCNMSSACIFTGQKDILFTCAGMCVWEESFTCAGLCAFILLQSQLSGTPCAMGLSITVVVLSIIVLLVMIPFV